MKAAISRTSARTQEEAKAKPARRRRILVIGSSARARAVGTELERLKPEVRSVPWDNNLATWVDQTCLALVLVEPLRGIRTVPALRALNDWQVPVFVVVGKSNRDNRARKIYQAGAAAVIAWPGEKSLFSTLLAEMLGLDQIRGEAARPDTALARVVKSRIKLLSGINGSLRIRVFDDHVRISGEVGSLWKKDRILKIAAETPGIRAVSTHNLRVSASGISDRTIGRSIRSVLKNTTRVDQTTLSMRVENGHVSLAGTFANRHELNRAIEMIRNVHGVRGIENLATVSTRKKRKDHQVASRIQKKILQLFPDEEIGVSVFGTVAVLQGRVALLAQKKQAEQIVSSDDSITRIVSKIKVA